MKHCKSLVVMVFCGSLCCIATQSLGGEPSAATCSGSPLVCVRFDNELEPPLPAPEELQDFTFANGGVRLIRGRENGTLLQWRVWSQVSVTDITPADLGPVIIDPTSAEDIEVKIMNPDTDPIQNPFGAGAANLTELDLDHPQAANFTNLSGGRINGSLNGALILQEDSGGGGEITANLNILGNLTGPLTVPKMSANLFVLGDYGAAGNNVDVGVIERGILYFNDIPNGTLTVQIDELGDDSVPEAETGGSFQLQKLTNSAVTVTIGNFVDNGDDPEENLKHSRVFVFQNFEGTLNLTNGIPGALGTNIVDIVTLSASGKINLGGPLDGSLLLEEAEAGAEITGGVLGGTIYIGESDGTFAGTATFDSVDEDGSIWAFCELCSDTKVSGTINVNGDLTGLIRIDGELQSTGQINVTGDVKPNNGLNGLIWIVEEVDGAVTVDGSVEGHVHFPGTVSGPMTFAGGIANTGLLKIGDGVTGETHSGFWASVGSPARWWCTARWVAVHC